MLFQCESRHPGDISLNHPARHTGGTRGRPVLGRGPGGSWRVAAVPRGTDSPGERKISSSRPEAHARLDPISARNLRRLPWAHALGAAPPVCQPDVTRGPPSPRSAVPTCFDRHMAVLSRTWPHGSQSNKAQESRSHPRLSTEGSHVGGPRRGSQGAICRIPPRLFRCHP